MILGFQNSKVQFDTVNKDSVLLTRFKCNSRVFCSHKGDFSVLAFSRLGLLENLT